jgi:glutaminyl-peptide cyclotransferase
MHRKLNNISFFLIFFSSFFACRENRNVPSNQGNETNPVIVNCEIIEFIRPFNNSVFKVGESVALQIRKVSDSILLDSVRIFIDDKYTTTLPGNKTDYAWNSKNSRLGHLTIQAEAYASEGKKETISLIVQLLSDSKPVNYTYKILNTYPHDRNAYVQGLIYENGYFYESDGEYGKSALRKYRLETGENIMFQSLDPSIFAEGIAIDKDKIFQITYKEHTGFVYDKTSFRLIRKFNYEFDEGWGFEFDGKNFLMTDGGSNIYFMEPEYFTQAGKIEVTSDEGTIDSINELELINGKIYANVYMQDFVLIIDPKTGKVLGKIDFKGILPKKDYDENTNVLNGIAWNPANGHLFITGKNWPKLFEVEIVKK